MVLELSTVRGFAAASRMLSGSLDYTTTLSTATRQAVPHLADWCALDMLD